MNIRKQYFRSRHWNSAIAFISLEEYECQITYNAIRYILNTNKVLYLPCHINNKLLNIVRVCL